MTFTLTELRECAEREVKLRRQVYRNRVQSLRMSPREAARQIAMMVEIAERLRKEEQAGMLI